MRIFLLLILIGNFFCDRSISFGQEAIPLTSDAVHQEVSDTIFAPLSAELREAIESTYGPFYLQTRQNLISKFLFSGQVGEQYKSCSPSDRKTLVFADQTVYMGFALTTFAFEVSLLKTKMMHGHSEALISYLLSGFSTLIDSNNVAKTFCGAQPMAFACHGSFLRDYVSRESLTPVEAARLEAQGACTIESDTLDAKSNPETHYNLMSNDQAVHMSLGLWAVHRYSTSEKNKQLARELFVQLYTYLVRNNFTIRCPAEHCTHAKPKISGDICIFVASFYHAIARDLGLSGISTNTEWTRPLRLRQFASAALVKCARCVGSTLGCLLILPCISQEVGKKANTFAINLSVIANAFAPICNLATVARFSRDSGHFLGYLLQAIVSGKPLDPATPVVEKVVSLLHEVETSRDEDRVFTNVSCKPDWSKDNRWVRTRADMKGAAVPDGGYRLYNGLDYLLLANAFRVAQASYQPAAFRAK